MSLAHAEPPPDPELVAEIDALVAEIRAFQRAAGRKVGGLMTRRRARKKPAVDTLAPLRGFEAAPPADFSALYQNWNGVEPKGLMSRWATNAFLDFDWPRPDFLGTINKVVRIEENLHTPGSLLAFPCANGPSLFLAPTLAVDAQTPLIRNWGATSEKSFVAFDSTLAFLRSTVAAQRAGCVEFVGEETRYAIEAFWAVIAPHNPRADYWLAELDGPIDWEFTEVESDIPGVALFKPETNRLVFGDPEKWRVIAEAEMAKHGIETDADVEAYWSAREADPSLLDAPGPRLKSPVRKP